ncbi:MAG TPA: TraR/DksA C4-type zinc finger protein [Acidimicrobiales bacterium]|nr:TraR/DksA C4-type zinc finger protein [Acidimicrobiales bacterium]
MSETSSPDFRALLEDERQKLQSELEDAEAIGGLQPSAWRGESRARVPQLIDALDELEHALHKVDNGSYGRCEECGQPIAPERLEFSPAARFCVACAS